MGNRIHTDILIIAYDATGTIAKMFEVHGAVVKKLAFSPLDSMSNEVMIETFELAYETLKCLDKDGGRAREPPGPRGSEYLRLSQAREKGGETGCS